MKIKKGLILREISGNYIVVSVDEMAKNFNGMVKLNETAAYLWGLIENGADKKALIEKLISEYDVSVEKATEDVNKVIKILEDNDFIDE